MNNKTITLYRNGEAIEIQQEAAHFTAIIPQSQWLAEVNAREEVEEVKQVFKNVYKIKTSLSDSDDLVTELRKDFSTRAVFHHAYRPLEDASTRYYLTDMVIVRFKKRTSTSRIETILQQCGLQFVKQYLGGERDFLLKVTSSAGKNPVKVCQDLHEMPEVIFAEPNLINRFDKATKPSDDLFNKQWHLESSTGVELVKDADVSALAAWEAAGTRGKRSIVVAVVDDGFDLTHPDFRGTGKVVHGRDFVDGDRLPFPSSAHNDYHGTPCAGVAIGEENGSGIVGIAPGCAFMPIRFDLRADDDLLWEIFNYTGQRADVISCSWGPVPVYAPLGSLLDRKFTELAKTGGPRGKGCIIVFAAGNFNAPIKDLNNRHFEWRHPSYGIRKHARAILNGNCAHPGVIAVSASTSQNRKAAYSNWGKEISVCAPSSNWHPLDPYKKMPGRGIWTTDNENQGLGFSSNSRYTGSFGGTSSSTPLVAGTAALLLSVNPELTAKEVRKILESTADRIIDRTPDPVLGNEKGTYKNKHSEWFGHGKINAAKAIAKVKADMRENEPPTEPIEPPVEPTEPVAPTTSTVSDGIKIVAALINPKGREAGQESISLLNFSDSSINLTDWQLANQRDKTYDLEGELAAGAFMTITIPANSAMKLSNSGGSLQLRQADGSVVHEVSYSKKQASKNGWTTLF